MMERVLTRSSLEGILKSAPDDYGLLIYLQEQQVGHDDASDGSSSSCCCRLQLVPDQPLPTIHPHGYGPHRLTETHLLRGGGSGVRVFRGNHELLGPLVMKHGAAKDTKELLALATISQQLQQRCQLSESASFDMQSRIPQFRMIYVSPQHLQDRPNMLSSLSWIRGFWESWWQSRKQSLEEDVSTKSHNRNDESQHSMAGSTDPGTSLRTNSILGSSKSGQEEGRVIRLYSLLKKTTRNSSKSVSVHSHSHRLDIVMTEEGDVDEETWSVNVGGSCEGYKCLKALVNELTQMQKKKLWKFTLAQKTIGGSSPKTAASYLTSGTLEGPLLLKLIEEYISIIRNLQELTHPNEVDVVERVRQELKEAEQDTFTRPGDVSEIADAFCGFSIRKNWHPQTGRFYRLRRMGRAFRKRHLYLTRDEVLPAKLLGRVLQEGTTMNEVYVGSPKRPTALEVKGYKLDTWRMLLKDAISLKSPAALHRIWNCGLSDGGLHNMFLSADDSMLYLFDMGEPKLVPLPGFLTKFLFSFFHTLGMVDDEKKGFGWVNRFRPVDGEDRVALTAETKRLLPKAYSAFQITLNKIIEDLFDSEEAVRPVLLNYVTLQLLSDAAFCLERWRIKGGGRNRKSNHHKHIEEWLWRALWDFYVASDLNTRKRLAYLGVT